MEDNLGIVDLYSYHLDENQISQIAGLSHLSEDGPGIKKLLEWGHTSPLEFASVTFYIKCPIFVARQWMRHRTGRYLEKSLRYCKPGEEFYIPEADEGSKELIKDLQEYCSSLYQKLTSSGISKEKARMVLPVSIYTEFYFQIDLRNLLSFFKLRLGKHAQKEIRDYAETILFLLSPIYPEYSKYVEEHYSSDQ